MKNKLFILGVLAIGIIVAVSVSLYKQGKYETERIFSVGEEQKKVSAERLIVIKKITETEKKKQDFRVELDRCGERIQQLQTEVLKERQKQEKLLEEFSNKERVFLELDNRLAIVTQQESELDNQLAKAKSDYQELVQKIEVTREEKTTLEDKIKARLSASRGVELKKIVVKLTPPPEGEVIEVNKKYNFAIVTLGLKDDIKSGDLFGLYRKDQLIARAVAENIYEDMSSILILEEWQDVPILKGDTVKLLK